jgi:hypothetical protein
MVREQPLMPVLHALMKSARSLLVGGFIAAVLMTTCIGQTQLTSEILRGRAAAGSVELYSEDRANSVFFKLRMMKAWYAMLLVDVNQNGLIDPGVDIGFGLTGSNPCNVYLMGADGRTTGCGNYHSGTKTSVIDNDKYIEEQLLIPKNELSLGAPKVSLVIKSLPNLVIYTRKITCDNLP